MKNLAKTVFWLCLSPVLLLIALIVLAITFHPTVSPGGSPALVFLIVAGETIGHYLAFLSIGGGLSGAFLAISTPVVKNRVGYAVASIVLLLLGFASAVFYGGGIPLS